MLITAVHSACYCSCARINVSHTDDAMSVRIRVRLITDATIPQPQIDIRMYGDRGDLMTLRAITHRLALV